MQDKEVVIGDAEECQSPGSEKSDSSPKSAKKERRDSLEEQGKKHQHSSAKDGKFQFRRMKQPKKEKASKKHGGSRFAGEGVSFKAKLIGVDAVPEPRGDKMCQDSMHLLKLKVKNSGPHKRKINVFVSLQGIKVKDEKTSEILYQHPVPLISFISQDITDARAFGYVAGSTSGQHQFIAIKTEKPAFHVVVALRDLFQTVLDLKQEEMEQAQEKTLDDQDTASSLGSDSLHEKSSVNENVTDSVSEEEKSAKDENIYFDVIMAEPFTLREPEPEPVLLEEVKDAPKSVDDLLGLQDELNKLQQGIAQLDTSLAAATFGMSPAEKDPFDTSFVTPSGPKIDVFPQPMPAPVPVTVSGPVTTQVDTSAYPQDKYAVFSALDSEPSVFESVKTKNASEENDPEDAVPDIADLEEEIKKKSTPPAKPPRNSKAAASADPTLFADLDPLGKDRPYKDKTEFFQDVKNPPKKVLNDLVSSSNGGDDPNRQNVVGSPPFPLSCSPRNLSSPTSFAVPSQVSPSSSSLPNASFLSTLKLSVGFSNGSPFNPFEPESAQNGASNGHLSSLSSSPIPIPSRNPSVASKDRSCSGSSTGSPVPHESPSSFSPTTNGYHHGPAAVPNGKAPANGVSRPRPRPIKAAKANVVPAPPQLLAESDGISRENMQCIANVLRVNGHRARAGSLPVLEAGREYRIQMPGDGNIFAKKADPFGDDFFCSLPKRPVASHLANTEIREYV